MKIRKTFLTCMILGFIVFATSCSAHKPVPTVSGAGKQVPASKSGKPAPDDNAPKQSLNVGPGKKVSLRGGGATFPALLYELCVQDFNEQSSAGHVGEYQLLGSMEGVEQLMRGDMDFAGSDWPLEGNETILQVPIVAGGVVVIYNIVGVPRTLNFTPAALAAIFGGKIRRWNDPAITDANPEVHLPSAEIVVVHRSDGSGTTHIFTNFLAHSNTDWSKENGLVVNWPRGAWFRGVDGNQAVADEVSKTNNSIGYVEYGYTLDESIGRGFVLNKAKKFVPASIEGIKRAMPGSETFDSGAVHMQERFPMAMDPYAYPISGFTWLIWRPDPKKAMAISDFAEWLLGPCQVQAHSKGYVPIPDWLVKKDLELIAKYRSESIH